MESKKIFNFGEDIKGYEVKVLNEREIRGAAGILFLFGIIGFLNSFITGNFILTKTFIVLFILDFSIRLFINPKFSPSIITSKIFLKKQEPEYVGAIQKKFAWWLGLILALMAFISLDIINYIGQ